MSSLQVPDMVEFRTFVDTRVPKLRDQIVIKTLYLTVSRVSEICTKTTNYDLQNNMSKPYGRSMTVDIVKDYRPQLINDKPQVIAVFKIEVAKRKKNPIMKSVAIPVDPEYEPWALDILKWALDHQKRVNFDLTRWAIWHIVSKNLKPLLDPLREARHKRDKEMIRNPLRHFRLTHLVDVYGFDGYDQTLVSGWTYRTGLQMSGMIDQYTHLNWRHYINKLLVPCRYQKAKAKKKEVAVAA